jgi:hypothetical protein
MKRFEYRGVLSSGLFLRQILALEMKHLRFTRFILTGPERLRNSRGTYY